MMTDDERRILQHLIEAWNIFVSLPELFPGIRNDNLAEFRMAIHLCQEKIMARPTIRKELDAENIATQRGH